MLTLAGCNTEPLLIGEWEAVQGEQLVKLEFREDSTFVMDLGEFVGEGRYMLADQDLVMTPTGPLAASVPGGFTGTVDWNTLNVCSPGGVCSEFVRPE